MKDEHEIEFNKGVQSWNQWRNNHHWFASVNLSEINSTKADLRNIDFRDTNLIRVNFKGAILNGADLRDANLMYANLESAQLVDCDLRGACLDYANLKNANLKRARLDLPDLSDNTLDRSNKFPRKTPSKFTSLQFAYLVGASLDEINGYGLCAEQANFAGASLRNSILTRANFRAARLNGAACLGSIFSGVAFDFASLVSADFSAANLCDCSAFGISAWDINVTEAAQRNIRITPDASLPIICDSLELAQFMYLLLNNRKIRDFVDTISTKLVLILGRFNDERKAVLEDIRRNVREAGFIPVLVDFEKPENRDLTETVSTIAHLSRLVIADLTDARSVSHELAVITPDLPSVQIQPICSKTDTEYGMFEHFKTRPWVLPTIFYDSIHDLDVELNKLLLPTAY